MDIDLEIDYSDRISDFLRSRLQEIQSENAHLEESLRHREDVLAQLHADFSKTNDDSVVLGEVWKRVVNDNYVVGLDIQNRDSNVLDNIEVFLTSSSSAPLSYRSYLISSTDPLKPTSRLSHSGQIVFVLPIPSFSDSLSHTLSGSIRVQKHKKKLLLQFPSTVLLTPEDLTDESLIVHSSTLIEGSLRNLLAVKFSGEKHDFVVVTPENLSLHLEVDCNLTKLNFPYERNFFLVQKTSPVVDGALLEVEEELGEKPQLSLYCKSGEVAMAVLHYLHRHLCGSVIIPRSMYQPDLSLEELVEQLRSVFTQMGDLARSHCKEEQVLKMMELDHEGDVLVARINSRYPNVTSGT